MDVDVRRTYQCQQINVAGLIWNHALALQRRTYRFTGQYLGLGQLCFSVLEKRGIPEPVSAGGRMSLWLVGCGETGMEDFVSGGYYLLRAGRPAWPPPFGDLLPVGNLISLSTCICEDRLSVLWGWHPGDRQAALQFGIPETRLPEFNAWCVGAYDEWLDVPSRFHTPEAARKFVKRFDIAIENLFIMGATLPHQQGEAGTPLGYDVVSFSYGDFAHSWLCSGLEHDMYEHFGIRTNHLGLLATYADAKRINDWIAEDKMRAEPEPYACWRLTSYPLIQRV